MEKCTVVKKNFKSKISIYRSVCLSLRREVLQVTREAFSLKDKSSFSKNEITSLFFFCSPSWIRIRIHNHFTFLVNLERRWDGIMELEYAKTPTLFAVVGIGSTAHLNYLSPAQPS
jgi:hypothetical protein